MDLAREHLLLAAHKLVLLAILLVGGLSRAQAGDVVNPVTLLVGFAIGQGTDLAYGSDPTALLGARQTSEPTYDQAAQFYADRLTRFLPGNPEIRVKRTPGAGSIVAALELERGPADGSQIALLGTAVVYSRLLGRNTAMPSWIGARQRDDDVCIFNSDIAVKDVEDLRHRETFVAALTPSSRSFLYPRALTEFAGLKLRVIPGYSTDFEVARALQTGEVEGWCGWSMQAIRARHSDLLRDGKVRVLIQFSNAPADARMQVVEARDLATGAAREVVEALEAQSMFGSFALAAPSAVTPEALATLRQAYLNMLHDSAALDEAGQLGFDVDPIPGEELDAMARKLSAMSPQAVELLRLLVQVP